MPYCTNCGEEVTAEQRYCSYCGEPVGDHHGHEQRGPPRERHSPGGAAERAPSGSPAEAPEQPPADAPGRSSDSRSAGGRPPRESAHEPQEGEASDEWHSSPPGERYAPRPGTFAVYYDALRTSIRLPAVLGLLFLAWALTGMPPALGPSLGLVAVIASVAIALLGMGIAYVYTEDEFNEGTATVGEAARQTAGQVVSLIGVWFVFAVVFTIGLSFFILPGLYLGGRLLLAFPACVLDGEAAIDSLSTSWELTSGDSLRPMGFLFAAGVAGFALSFVLSIPQSVILSSLDVGVNDAQTVDELLELVSDPQFALVNSIFTGLAMALPVTAAQIAAARMYLDNRYGVREQSFGR